MSNNSRSSPKLDPNELFKEKTAWDILYETRKIKVSKLNYAVTSLTMVTLGVFSICRAETDYLISFSRQLASYWLSIGLNTLGFLVSGFAIYTALGKPSLFIRMAQMRHESGLSWLKYVLFVFVEVLIFYVVFAAICAFVVIFCGPSGPASQLLDTFSITPIIRHIMASIAYTSLGTGIVWSIVILASYVYNIYSSVLACVLSEDLPEPKNDTAGA